MLADGLEQGEDYDGETVEDLDWSGQDASNVTLVECALVRCTANDLRLRRSRLVETKVTDLQATAVDTGESTWRDSALTGGRVGAFGAAGSQWRRVRLAGLKVDYLNLRAAELEDCLIDGCVIGELDAADATLTRLVLTDTRIGELVVRGAGLEDVDLRGAQLAALSGAANIRGAIVTSAQLLDLAPLLADELGLDVRDG